MLSYLTWFQDSVKETQEPIDGYTNCNYYPPWIHLKASGIAALKQSVSICTDKPGQNQHWHDNEGRRGCEGGSAQRDNDTNREKRPESSCTTACCGHDHKTQARTRPCGRWEHRAWGPQCLNQGSNFPCWTSKVVVVTDFLCDSYKNGPQNSDTEPQETAILLSHQPPVSSAAIWLSRPVGPLECW